MMMSDPNSPSPSGLGGIYGGAGGLGGAQGLSPYLNVDPSYLQTATPEFIFNQDTKRGRMENSFTAIGSSLLIGGGLGGSYGLYEGVRSTAAEGMKGAMRRTQVLNYVVKSGSTGMQSLGTLAVMYSTVHLILSQFREDDDAVKTLMAGGVTGALFKSTAGVKKCGMGGAFGLGVAALWAFVLKKNEKVSQYV